MSSFNFFSVVSSNSYFLMFRITKNTDGFCFSTTQLGHCHLCLQYRMNRTVTWCVFLKEKVKWIINSVTTYRITLQIISYFPLILNPRYRKLICLPQFSHSIIYLPAYFLSFSSKFILTLLSLP